MLELNGRQAEFPIHPVFLQRWSPRAFAQEEIARHTLMTILEAARWAPSAYNVQPWRFAYALRDSAGWQRLLALLMPFNQNWAKSAAALVFVFSKLTTMSADTREETPFYSHAFDTGAAWSHLALQAAFLGWHTHGMLGFDKDRALTELNAPPGFRAEVAIAIGRIGDISTLEPKLAAREIPSDRKRLHEIAAEGLFPVCLRR